MEGGGPGPGAAQPQYEEQLLHTQVKSSCLACLTLKFSPLTSCSVALIHIKDLYYSEKIEPTGWLGMSLSKGYAFFWTLLKKRVGVKPMLKKYRFRNGILTGNWHNIGMRINLLKIDTKNLFKGIFDIVSLDLCLILSNLTAVQSAS